MHLLSDFALKSPLLYNLYSIEKSNLFFQTETFYKQNILLQSFGSFWRFSAISGYF